MDMNSASMAEWQSKVTCAMTCPPVSIAASYQMTRRADDFLQWPAQQLAELRGRAIQVKNAMQKIESCPLALRLLKKGARVDYFHSVEVSGMYRLPADSLAEATCPFGEGWALDSSIQDEHACFALAESVRLQPSAWRFTLSTLAGALLVLC